MFELQDTPAKISGVNIRSELHGDRHVPAVDVSVTFDLANDSLKMFSKALQGALFAKQGKTAAPPPQGELAEVEPISDMPHLRDLGLEMAKLRLTYEGVGYHVGFGIGVSGHADIELDDCKVTKIAITPKEGGTVSYSLQVQASGLDEDVLGRLCTIIGSSVDLTLVAPAEQAALAA